MAKMHCKPSMVVWQRPDGEWDYVYGYDESIASEPVLSRVNHELGIGELSMRPEQFEEDKPWLLVSRDDLTAMDRRLGLGQDEEIETGEAIRFESDTANREHDVEYLLVLNALRNLMRSRADVERFFFTEVRE